MTDHHGGILHPREREEVVNEMTHGSVYGLICRLAIPTIVTMMVSALYNIVDTYFVGKLSRDAIAAVGIAFSVMCVIQACGFFWGQGSGIGISKQLGADETADADATASVGFFGALLMGTVIAAVGMAFLEPLSVLLGANKPVLLAETKRYMACILMGAPFMMGAISLNVQFRQQGRSMLSMLGIASGAVLNTVLDPLLMFGLGLDVVGAGVATSLSQAFSCAVLLGFNIAGNGVRVRLRNFRPRGRILAEIAGGGLPSLFRQGTSSISTACLNVMAGEFGVAAVAAMSIVSRVMNLNNSFITGFGQGFQPVCGFNYGAKRYDRVLKAFRFTLWTAVCIQLVISAAGIIFAPDIIGIFRKGDTEIIEFGRTALRLQCISSPLASVVLMANMLTQVMGKTPSATFLATAKNGLFFIPLVFLLTHAFGAIGLQSTQVFSDLLAFVCTLIILRLILRELRSADRLHPHSEPQTAGA